MAHVAAEIDKEGRRDGLAASRADVVKRVDVGRERVLIELEREAGMHRLSPQRRHVVGETLDNLANLVLGSAFEEDLSAKQLEEQGRVAIDALRLLVEGGPERLEALIAALETSGGESGESSDEDSEARARMRLHALHRRIVQDSYSVAELAEQMRLSRQRLKQLRDQDRLFAIEVPFHRGWFYPRWQFEIASGKPWAELPELIATARSAGLDAAGFHLLMSNPTAGDGISPLALLEAGDKEAVLQILRGANQ